MQKYTPAKFTTLFIFVSRAAKIATFGLKIDLFTDEFYRAGILFRFFNIT